MRTEDRIKVIVADDHGFFVEGLNMVIARNERYHVVHNCKDGDELVSAVHKHDPDLIITDLSMPVLSGVKAIRIIREFNARVPFLILSGLENEFMIVEALEAGAIGYINKLIAHDELYTAMDTVYNKMPYYCTTTSNKLAKMIGSSYFNPYANDKSGLFSDLEKQIIKLICEDMKSAEIAKILCLGIRTVENYRGRIIKKMNVQTTAGIAIYAVKNEMFFLKD